jgi:hypothetical protein
MVARAFISYSWDDDAHREWVRGLAERLRADGVDVTLDQWAAVPGDQLPAFMETAIRENEFVVVICTPRYKQRSDNREGGVGYEGDIMSAEVLNQGNHRKFIPVLRQGAWPDASPSWLAGRYYINLTGSPYSERDYEDLARTLLGIRQTAPPLGEPLSTVTRAHVASAPTGETAAPEFEDIKITRVIVEDVSEPRSDGTPGSALYRVPFALSRRPPADWAEAFVAIWDRPPRWTSMHRPGIARISGATLTLDGTTIDEVERVHRDTLQIVVEDTNRRYREWLAKQQAERAREAARSEEHRRAVEEAAKRISFD